MVASSQPLATQAGLSILMNGGNAADAAIATAAALNVTEPTSTGIGGDCFALYYDANTKAISALNASGRAPQALNIDLVERQGLNQQGRIPPRHAHAVTVPGACSGWCALIEHHGTMNLQQLLAPAIRLAENGFPVSPITAHAWKASAAHELRSGLGGQALTIGGAAPAAGQLFRNPGLARTFRMVAEGGAKAFYHGAIADAITLAVQRAGGVLADSDLSSHQPTWDEPISTTYRSIHIWECPPSGQGLATLIALNIFEGLPQSDELSVSRIHGQIESMQLAFADVLWHVADPAFSPAPLATLLSKGYAAQRRDLIDPSRANPSPLRGTLDLQSDTVYFCVVDGEGNACSFINSNYQGFGTGIVPEGFGFSLQNRGHNFTLDPEHPNALQPGKRPYHTIIPAMATRSDGSLLGPFGVMGAFMQPQGHFQVIVNLIDDGCDPQTALDRPRFCVTGQSVSLEEGLPADSLSQLGHDTAVVDGYHRSLFGRGQIIVRNHDGVLTAGSDMRGDGCALGF